MNILFTGSIDGEILDFYSRVLEFQRNNKIAFDWIFAVGDFGIWPDPQRIDRATRTFKKTAGDFPYLYLNQWEAPVPTIVTCGIHEDHDWLEKRLLTGNLELMPNISLLANGSHLTLEGLAITGVGKSYSQAVYTGKRNSNSSYSRKDIENAKALPSQLVLSYEPLAGTSIAKFKSIAQGIDEIVNLPSVQLHVHSTPAKLVNILELEENKYSIGLGKRLFISTKYENNTFSLNK